MRPPILFPLFAGIETLAGVGKALSASFARINITKMLDLLWHFPVSVIDRSRQPALSAVAEGEIFTAIITVGQHYPPPAFTPKRRPKTSLPRHLS